MNGWERKRGWSPDSIEEKKWRANYTLKKKRTNSRRWYIDNWPNERTLFWRHSSSFFLSFFILTKHFLPVDFLLAGIWSRAEFHPLTFFTRTIENARRRRCCYLLSSFDKTLFFFLVCDNEREKDTEADRASHSHICFRELSRLLDCVFLYTHDGRLRPFILFFWQKISTVQKIISLLFLLSGDTFRADK